MVGLSTDDNAWLYLATPAQVEPLLVAWQKDPASLPLFGVPFAVKDNIDVAGWPTASLQN